MLDPLAARGRRTDDPLYRRGEDPIESMADLRGFLSEREDVRALSELVNGDRLRMCERVGLWIEQRCFLLDYRRLVYDSLPMVVAAGPTIRGTEEMGPWIEGVIDVASEALLEQDARLAKEAAALEEPIEPRFQFLMDSLMFTPEKVRLATVAANELKMRERHVFYHCFVIGKGFAAYEQETGVSAEQAKALLMRSIDRLCEATGGDG